MPDPLTFQGPTAKPLSILAFAAAAAIGATTVFGSPNALGFAMLGFPVLMASTAWTIFWHPAVAVTPSSLIFHNVFTDVVIPWAAVEDFDVRYGLRAVLVDGGQEDAWALPASRPRPQRPEGSRLPRMSASAVPSVQGVLDYWRALPESTGSGDPEALGVRRRVWWPSIIVISAALVWVLVGVLALVLF